MATLTVTEKSMMMGDGSLKRLLYRVTEKSTMTVTNH
jgi:hypothetical protein